jgi:hypothetical protein
MALKRYRLKIFDGRHEVLHKAKFYVDVDLDTPEATGVLDRQFVALVHRARTADNEPMTNPIMHICDHVNGETVREWH